MTNPCMKANKMDTKHFTNTLQGKLCENGKFENVHDNVTNSVLSWLLRISMNGSTMFSLKLVAKKQKIIEKKANKLTEKNGPPKN